MNRREELFRDCVFFCRQDEMQRGLEKGNEWVMKHSDLTILLTETWGERKARTQVAFHFFSFSFLIFTINSLNENMIMCNYRYNSAEWDECDSHSPTWQRTEESFLHSNNVQLGLVLIYSWHNNCYRNEHYHRYFAKEFFYYYCSCILFMLSVWRTYSRDDFWAAR